MINIEGYIVIGAVLFCLYEAIHNALGLKINICRLIKWLMKNGYSLSKWLLWDFSGAKAIVSRIYPALIVDEKNQPSTFLLWMVGIYVAFFSIASERYENRIDIIENRANAIFSQLGTDAFKKALSRIHIVQNMPCPEKPNILNPLSVYRSIFNDSKNEDMVELLKETLEDWKVKLEGVQLMGTDLTGANLTDANLEGARLTDANLTDADLVGAGLRGAVLQKANLTNANLEGADLTGAYLKGAILCLANTTEAKLNDANLIDADLRFTFFNRTNLEGADLTRAKFGGIALKTDKLWELIIGASFISPKFDGLLYELKGADQLCRASTLRGTQFDSDIKIDVMKKCPLLMEMNN